MITFMTSRRLRGPAFSTHTSTCELDLVNFGPHHDHCHFLYSIGYNWLHYEATQGEIKLSTMLNGIFLFQFALVARSPIKLKNATFGIHANRPSS